MGRDGMLRNIVVEDRGGRKWTQGIKMRELFIP